MQEGKLLKIEFKEWKESKIKTNSGFFPIWNEFKPFLKVTELTGGALRLYIFLGLVSKNDTGESWYSISKIAQILECSDRSVSTWLKELQTKKLIKRIQTSSGSSYTYLIPYPSKEKKEEKI